jgi:hypothetical protein
MGRRRGPRRPRYVCAYCGQGYDPFGGRCECGRNQREIKQSPPALPVEHIPGLGSAGAPTREDGDAVPSDTVVATTADSPDQQTLPPAAGDSGRCHPEPLIADDGNKRGPPARVEKTGGIHTPAAWALALCAERMGVVG